MATGVGFLDHMLELLARDGDLGLTVEATGDLDTGAHHTTEDVGIALDVQLVASGSRPARGGPFGGRGGAIPAA